MQLLPLFVELFFFFFASKRRWKFGREWFWRIRTVGRGGDTLRFSTNKPASVALCLSASVPWWHCTVPPVSLAIVLRVASGHMVGTVPHYHLLLQLYLVELFCIQSQFLLSFCSIVNPLRASWSTGAVWRSVCRNRERVFVIESRTDMVCPPFSASSISNSFCYCFCLLLNRHSLSSRPIPGYHTCQLHFFFFFYYWKQETKCLSSPPIPPYQLALL